MTSHDRDWALERLQKLHDNLLGAEAKAKAYAAELRPGDDPLGMRLAVELGTLRGYVSGYAEDVRLLIGFLTPRRRVTRRRK